MESQNRFKNLVLAIVVGVLIVTNMVTAWYAWNIRLQQKALSQQLESLYINGRVVTFLRLFINTVLKAETEVAFQKRLQLEDAVRALGDDEVSAQWNRFVNSQTELEAQTNTKNLLGLLADKIKVSEQAAGNK